MFAESGGASVRKRDPENTMMVNAKRGAGIDRCSMSGFTEAEMPNISKSTKKFQACASFQLAMEADKLHQNAS